MSKERPPACKNLRSFQTAEKGDLRANLSLGASFRGDMSPRSEARTCPHNSISPARRPAEKFLIKPTRAERDVYGRPSPTCDLVKATSVALREPSAFTSSRKLEPVTA